MTKEEQEAFQNAWIESSTSWEQGAEGPSATDRGSFKSGWFRALRWNDAQVKEGFLENLSKIRKENIALHKQVKEFENAINKFLEKK